ncbi:MAG: aminomethyl-transferring glycine dehydrogenase subunit GcvPB [Candidatus Omnitrophota bacterium]
MDRKLIFEKSVDQRKTNYISETGVPDCDAAKIIPKVMLRDELSMPWVGELDVVRHYTRLAQDNFSVDTHFYPLGSCTMKYNPKINEQTSAFKGFMHIHPYQPQESLQGALELIYNLERLFCEITGMSSFSFQPSSGAHGELCGMLMIKKYHKINKRKKTKVLIPDSAHGTNPATAAMCGYKTQTIPSNKKGLIDIDALKKAADSDTAAIMLTNPNTLGLFEENILEISKLIHSQGGLLYYDGANFNPLLGITKPSLMGFDVIHLNLHKTFSTPHGCGGPGAGAVGVVDELKDFLPVPVVGKSLKGFFLDYSLKNSIGRVRSFYGNFSVLVRAYTYLLREGGDGLIRIAHNSVLNANYIKGKLKNHYEAAFDKPCMHEVVFSCTRQKQRGASALDIAKRLIDYGVHPPTMYFPLVVKEALMVEPTESENKERLDYFINALISIDKEIDANLDLVKSAPHSKDIKRVDEVKAARFPDLCCR